MVDPTTPAAIARRLTPRQREALLWLPGDGEEKDAPVRSQLWSDLWLMASFAITTDISVHLTRRSIQTGHDNHWYATPLGIRVRAAVEAGDAT